MTNIQRTCSTCCSFAPNDGSCCNLVTFRARGGDSHPPLPNDVCGDHQTQREYDAEDRAISLFWLRLSLPRPSLNFDDGGMTA